MVIPYRSAKFKSTMNGDLQPNRQFLFPPIFPANGNINYASFPSFVSMLIPPLFQIYTTTRALYITLYHEYSADVLLHCQVVTITVEPLY